MNTATASAELLERRILDMFQSEWIKSGRTAPLATIAIVDGAPQEQYLYPAFLLFQRLFQRGGIMAIICDPSQLEWRAGVLWFEDKRLDLAYNRLTDFLLAGEENTALRTAYLENAVVLTPIRKATRCMPTSAIWRCRATPSNCRNGRYRGKCKN